MSPEDQTPDTKFARDYLAERMRDPEFRTEFEAAAVELARRTETNSEPRSCDCESP